MQPSIVKVVETLLEGTKNGTIEWEPTHRKTEFRTRMGAAAITVDKWDWTNEYTDDSVTSADITIYNKEGEKIDTCVADAGPDFRALSDLHEVVRRKVLKVDETLATLLQELEGKVTGSRKSQ